MLRQGVLGSVLCLGFYSDAASNHLYVGLRLWEGELDLRQPQRPGVDRVT